MSGTTGSATLRFGLPDAAAARAAQAALQPENGPHCTMHTEGRTLVVTVPEAHIGSFAATIDDVLACLSAVQRARDAAP